MCGPSKGLATGYDGYRPITWRRATGKASLRLERMFQQVGEHASDALAAHVAVGTEPLRHPVDRAHEEEHRHARIGLADAAVLYTLGDQLAELLLKIVTALRDHGAVFG